jgi:hypothetical protein
MGVLSCNVYTALLFIEQIKKDKFFSFLKTAIEFSSMFYCLGDSKSSGKQV